jgi:hypothetical protein
MRLPLAIVAALLLFYFFTAWQALVLIGIGGLIVAVLHRTGHWKPDRQFAINVTAKDSKNDVLLMWTVMPAKHLFKRDLAVFSDATEYHSVYEYRIDGERVSMRLVESTIESGTKPMLYRVRDGVVGTSWIADWYGERLESLGVGEVEELKDGVEWHDAPLGIRYFILKHTSGHREFLASERERLKRGVSNAEAELRSSGIRQDTDGVYIGPDGPEDELVRSLLSDDHLSKYGITSDEFYRCESLLRFLPRFSL